MVLKELLVVMVLLPCCHARGDDDDPTPIDKYESDDDDPYEGDDLEEDCESFGMWPCDEDEGGSEGQKEDKTSNISTPYKQNRLSTFLRIQINVPNTFFAISFELHIVLTKFCPQNLSTH